MDPSTTSLLILTVVLTSAAILLTYILVGTRVEARVVKSQTTFVIRQLLGDVQLLPTSWKSDFKLLADRLKPGDMSAEDREAATANRKILVRGVVIVALGCLLGVLVSRAVDPLNFSHNLYEASVAAALACITEAAFALLIAGNYECADPNEVRLLILQRLKTE